MASMKIHITVMAGTIVLAAMTGALGLQRLANNPTLLYVAGQVQIAIGHRDDGLSLISRAALSTADHDAPAAKPSPVKSASENCPSGQLTRKTPISVARVRINPPPVASVGEDFYFQKVSKQVPNAPRTVKFDLPPVGLQKVETEEINRQVHLMRERIVRQIQKAGPAPRISSAG